MEDVKMNDEIQIDKNVPMPHGRQSRSFLRKAIDQLEVEDSFFYPDTGASFRGHCYTHAAFAGIKVTVRQCKENEIDGVRVWRTK